MITSEQMDELRNVLGKMAGAAEHPERVTCIQHPEYQCSGSSLVRNTIEVVVHQAREPRQRA